ncbi:MAG: ATP-binding cassette domain-containing protein, partial [Gemmatimonadota bacterium]|nr:ATP-binding cassette domain-containing protein [Gemmatimonadota bacterium]
MPDDIPAIEIRDLHKRYGDVHALKGIDLTIPRGAFFGLLGPNGAGKTTLVSIIAGLRSADGGRVTVGGVDALAAPDEARRVLGL